MSSKARPLRYVDKSFAACERTFQTEVISQFLSGCSYAYDFNFPCMSSRRIDNVHEILDTQLTAEEWALPGFVSY